MRKNNTYSVLKLQPTSHAQMQTTASGLIARLHTKGRIMRKLKAANRFKQFFLWQICAWWSLFNPKSTQFFLDAYSFKRDYDFHKEADKDL